MVDISTQTPVEQVIKQLNSSATEGLNTSVIKQRVAAQLQHATVVPRWRRELRLLVSQFTSPLVLLLVIAVVLSALLGEATDTVIIMAILLISGLLGFWQEMTAGRAVEQLQRMIQLTCRVVRQGQTADIDLREVVPGDIILLKAGDVIPADCRVIEGNELHLNESTITGESYPVEKKPGEVAEDLPLAAKTNSVWQGTSVVSGTGRVIAMRTGGHTIFGQMAHSLVKDPETAFEKGIKHFGYFLMQITIVLAVMILGVNLYFHRPVFDSILFALAIAVGMAPELLPAIMTFAMSAGARRMLDKKVIVRKLSSIFNLGEVQLLCTDKTGTITEGVIRVKEVITPDGHAAERIRLLASLNAVFQNGFPNPIDDAISDLHIDIAAYSKSGEVPYDFIRKRLSVAVRGPQGSLMVTKGAVDNILAVCTQQRTVQGDAVAVNTSAIRDIYARYCNSGLRLIGICSKSITTPQITREDEADMVFEGFIVLEDPLKQDVLESLDRLRKLDVEVKIITGDNRYVAAYVASQLGIASPQILTGADLDAMLPEALVVKAVATNIFAEIEPYQKEQIIRALQKSHYTVAYMGDGINDVAAIHAADTGISTNNAVDVARQAADFVLLDKDLSVLADGVIEGRKTFANSLKYIFINTGSTFGNMFSVAGASLLLPFLPMLPKQILLTNFLTDVPFLAISSDNVDEDQIARPGRWNMKMIRNFMIIFGLHSSIFDFITFYLLYFVFSFGQVSFRTGWFIESVLTELLILFIMRTRRPFIRSTPGRWLLILGVLSMLVTVWLPFSPFSTALGLNAGSVKEALTILAVVVCYIVTADILKVMFFRYATVYK